MTTFVYHAKAIIYQDWQKRNVYILINDISSVNVEQLSIYPKDLISRH